MADTETIRNIVKTVLRENLDEVRVESVTVRPDKDADGDDIYWVDVVVDTGGKRPDPRRTTPLHRYIRSHMLDEGDETVPVLSFIGKNELKARNAETA